MKKAIVLGASRGIGKSISDYLQKLDFEVLAASSDDIDTSNIQSVNKFAEANNSTDVFSSSIPNLEPSIKPFSA